MLKKVFLVFLLIFLAVSFNVAAEETTPGEINSIVYGEYNSAFGPGIGFRGMADKAGFELLYYFGSKSKSATTEEDTSPDDNIIEFKDYTWEAKYTGGLGVNLFFVVHEIENIEVLAGGGLLFASGTTKVTANYEEPYEDETDTIDGEFKLMPLHAFIGGKADKDNFVFDGRLGIVGNTAVKISEEVGTTNPTTGEEANAETQSHSINLFDNFYLSASVGYCF